MNAHLDGGQELIVVDNDSTDDPEAEAGAGRAARSSSRWTRTPASASPRTRGVARASEPVTVLLNPDTELLDAGLDRLAATAAELGGLVGPRVLNADRTVQPSASGPEVGAWPWVRALVPAAIQPRGAARPHRALPARASRPGHLAHRLLHRRADRDPAPARARSTRRCTCTARTSTSGCAPRRPGSARGSTRPPAALVHHGQGSSQLVYGSREGWRPAGTLNWRAALRRAYGPRREALAWRALRLNLRLRLIVKTLLGRRRRERDRAALAGGAPPSSIRRPPAEAPASHAADRAVGRRPGAPSIATLSEVNLDSG